MVNKKVFWAFHQQSGELLETLTDNAEGNQQPSSSSEEKVDEKVQRLTGEGLHPNKPDTSARPEMEDIVRHSLETRRVEDKELLHN